MDVFFTLPEDCDILIDDQIYDQFLEFSGDGHCLKLKVEHEHLKALAHLLAEYGYCTVEGVING